MFNNPKIICQVCGKAGHIAPQCYHLFDINYVGNANITMNLCSAIGINQENHSETNSVVQSLNLPKPIHSSSGFFFFFHRNSMLVQQRVDNRFGLKPSRLILFRLKPFWLHQKL